jgi:hypothetical protein
MDVGIQPNPTALFVKLYRLIAIPLFDGTGLFLRVDTTHSTGWSHD